MLTQNSCGRDTCVSSLRMEASASDVTTNARQVLRGEGTTPDTASISISSDEDFQDEDKGKVKNGRGALENIARERGGKGNGKPTIKGGRERERDSGGRESKKSKLREGGAVEQKESWQVAERIGNDELLLLGIVPEGGPGVVGGGGAHAKFLAAFDGAREEWPDDVIQGTRLGDKVVGRKSRFAGVSICTFVLVRQVI